MGAEPLGRTAESTFGRRPEIPGSRGGTHAAVTGEVSRSAYYQFAAYNGTAPIEASSGNRNIHRLSRRGNRQLNHAVHIAAVTQIRNHGTTGRIYYDRKVAEGMARKAALRALKRKVSDAIYARLIIDARAAGSAPARDPGGQTRNDSASSATGSHPETPALRRSHSRANTNSRTSETAATADPSMRASKQTRRAT